MQSLPQQATGSSANSDQALNRSPKIVVGLGNPGLNYRQTRHNLGFDVLDHCSDLLKIHFVKDQSKRSMIAKGCYNNRDLILLKPLTYMNLSGHSLSLLRKTVLFELQDILVVCDDIALPFGAMRLRSCGGSGGHNGLKSLNQSLGSTHFTRLRVGIGQPPVGVALDAFVLGFFCDDEKKELPTIVTKAAKSVLKWIEG